MDSVRFAQCALLAAELILWVLWFQRPSGYRTVYRMYRGGWWLNERFLAGIMRLSRGKAAAAAAAAVASLSTAEVWWPSRWKRPEGGPEPRIDVPLLLGALTFGTLFPTVLAAVIVTGRIS